MYLLTKGSCISMVGSATIINVLRTFSHANDVLFVAHDHVNYFCFSLIKSCPTLCDLMDCSMLGFLVLPCPLEIAQTRCPMSQ